MVLRRSCTQRLPNKQNTGCWQSVDTAALQARLTKLAEAHVDALLTSITDNIASGQNVDISNSWYIAAVVPCKHTCLTITTARDTAEAYFLVDFKKPPIARFNPSHHRQKTWRLREL